MCENLQNDERIQDMLLPVPHDEEEDNLVDNRSILE